MPLPIFVTGVIRRAGPAWDGTCDSYTDPPGSPDEYMTGRMCTLIVGSAMASKSRFACAANACTLAAMFRALAPIDPGSARPMMSIPDAMVSITMTNAVPTAPLSGTEPLIAALGLTPITGSTQSAAGIRGATRFTAGGHGSLLDPSIAPAVTQEMQTEMASMLVSGGTAVQVAVPSVIKQ